MPKPLDSWLWKAAREWQMPGIAQLHFGTWHRGEPDSFAPCGKWLGVGFIRAAAGEGQQWPNPWSSRPLHAGELCPRCFADGLPLIQAVWKANGFGGSIGVSDSRDTGEKP